MNMTRVSFILLISFVLILSNFYWNDFEVVFAQERSAGVKVGDWAKYKVFSLSGSGLGDYNLTDILPSWFKNTVSELSNPSYQVAYNSLWHWVNGTEKTYPSWISLIADPMGGEFGNRFGGFSNLDFIATNLNPGDIVADTPQHYDGGVHSIWYIKEWKINETISRTYLGISRQINHFNGTYVDPGNTPHSVDYSWDKQTGILTEFAMKTVANEGSLLFSYTIVDTNLWGDKTPPIANAGSDQTVEVGASLIFDASGSNDDVGIVSYEWHFGDGTPKGTGVSTTHTYVETGNYIVTLKVEDAAGNSDIDTLAVVIIEASGGGFPLWIYGLVIALMVIIVALGLVIWRLRARKISRKKQPLDF